MTNSIQLHVMKQIQGWTFYTSEYYLKFPQLVLQPINPSWNYSWKPAHKIFQICLSNIPLVLPTYLLLFRSYIISKFGSPFWNTLLISYSKLCPRRNWLQPRKIQLYTILRFRQILLYVYEFSGTWKSFRLRQIFALHRVYCIYNVLGLN